MPLSALLTEIIEMIQHPNELITSWNKMCLKFFFYDMT